MASRRTLIRRLLGAAARPPPPPPRTPAASPLRCLLSGRSIHQAGAIPLGRRTIPFTEGLIDRLRSLGGERIRLDALAPPPLPPRGMPGLEGVKGRLMEMGEESIAYERFVEVCGEERIAKALEEGGDVLVVGNVVFLRPEQVARAIQSIIQSFLVARAPPVPAADDPRWSELDDLEKAEASIDARATAGVRRELWGGLAYLVAQTALFMRLTFWELSWDVMEPICFYVTSIYFMAGYGFFLRTSKDPSFEGFFESRFTVRRRRLMKAEGFDPLRLHELRRALGVSPRPAAGRDPQLNSMVCECHRRNGLSWMVH